MACQWMREMEVEIMNMAKIEQELWRNTQQQPVLEWRLLLTQLSVYEMKHKK